MKRLLLFLVLIPAITIGQDINTTSEVETKSEVKGEIQTEKNQPPDWLLPPHIRHKKKREAAKKQQEAPRQTGSDQVAITLNSITGKYDYSLVVKFDGVAKETIRNAALAQLYNQASATQNTDDWFVTNPKMRLGGDATIQFLSKFGFKEGRLKWIATDFYYDNPVFGISAPEPLEKMSEKKLRKIAEDINIRLQRAIDEHLKGMRNHLNQTSTDDW